MAGTTAEATTMIVMWKTEHLHKGGQGALRMRMIGKDECVWKIGESLSNGDESLFTPRHKFELFEGVDMELPECIDIIELAQHAV